MEVLLKLANFKIFIFFWKYNSKPLTFIFNLARRYIQKKVMSTIQKFTLFWQIWKKMTKNAIFWVKKCISELVSRTNHYPRCKAFTLVNSQKKLFLKLGNFTTHYSSSNRIYKIYILRIFWRCQNFQMKLPNFNFLFIFSNFCVCLLTYISKLTRELKLGEIRLFEFEYQEFPILIHQNIVNYYGCVIYILSFTQPHHYVILD